MFTSLAVWISGLVITKIVASETESRHTFADVQSISHISTKKHISYENNLFLDVILGFAQYIITKNRPDHVPDTIPLRHSRATR